MNVHVHVHNEPIIQYNYRIAGNFRWCKFSHKLEICRNLLGMRTRAMHGSIGHAALNLTPEIYWTLNATSKGARASRPLIIRHSQSRP